MGPRAVITQGRPREGATAKQRPVPAVGPSQRLLSLQRAAGNRAVGALVRDAAHPVAVQRREEKPGKKDNNITFDNTQYRVTGSREDRKIELVTRGTRRDGTPFYQAVGRVIGFERKLPIIDRYDQPIDLGNWAPKVTHINGMGVTPQSGLTSAEALLDSVQAKIKQAGNDVAIDQSAIDVLFTYSAKRSNFLGDIWNCIKGKARVEDDVTRSQEQTMLDAIAAKRRLHVSAHSRGTIKTDNAVRTVFKILVDRYVPGLRDKSSVKKEARQRAKELEETGLFDAGMAYDLALEQCARSGAEDEAKRVMDKYIQLVYGGNAVQYPSSVLPVEMFVGKGDFVSMFVGTYTDWGAKLASGNDRSQLHKQSGGHSYTTNYAAPVGGAIGSDMIREARKKGSR